MILEGGFLPSLTVNNTVHAFIFTSKIKIEKRQIDSNLRTQTNISHRSLLENQLSNWHSRFCTLSHYSNKKSSYARWGHQSNGIVESSSRITSHPNNDDVPSAKQKSDSLIRNPACNSLGDNKCTDELSTSLKNNEGREVQSLDYNTDKESVILQKIQDGTEVHNIVGPALLLLVSLLWGAYGVQIKYIYSQPGPPHPSLLTFARKALALVSFGFLLPFEKTLEDFAKGAPSTSSTSPSTNEGVWKGWDAVWFPAVELGLWNFLGTALQAAGLEQTTAMRAGFEVQLTSVLVPLLAWIGGERPRAATWGAAVLALIGLGLLLTQDELHSAVDTVTVSTAAVSSYWEMAINLWSATVGDLLVLGAALFYSLATVRLTAHARHVPAVKLSASVMTMAAFLAMMWSASDFAEMAQKGEPLLSAWEGWDNPSVFAVLLLSAVASGSIAGLAQTLGQGIVSSSEAQVLYSFTPVFSATFSALFLGESITLEGCIGASFILMACIISSK